MTTDPDTRPTMTLERLGDFGAAWRRHDLDALMKFITDDCEFRASVGPEPGTVFTGREQVRHGFALMLQHDDAAEGHDGVTFITGEQGFSQWSFTYPDEHGKTGQRSGGPDDQGLQVAAGAEPSASVRSRSASALMSANSCGSLFAVRIYAKSRSGRFW
jgi:taurine dehydrogenase small subunit